MKKDTCTFSNAKIGETIGEGYCNMEFTPQELSTIQDNYADLDIDCCPFCRSKKIDIKEIDFSKEPFSQAFECRDCLAAWQNTYTVHQTEFKHIPTRAALCFQHDSLVMEAIERLRSYGDKYLAERLENLIMGGFSNASL